MEWSSAVQQRNHFKHTDILEKRLADEARRLREEAELLPPGPARNDTMRKARQAETGSHISEWLRSPGLQPPRWGASRQAGSSKRPAQRATKMEHRWIGVVEPT